MFLCDLNRKIMIMMFNATFNNISVLLVEETRVPGENHRSDKLDHIMLYNFYTDFLTLSNMEILIDYDNDCSIFFSF
jgi:hypothetical protein